MIIQDGIAGRSNDNDTMNDIVLNSSIKGRNYVGGITGYYDESKTQIKYNRVENTEISGSETFIGGIVGYTAVSYTHLDVYKRQAYNK